ncbi:MAG: NAD(P)H-hydrate dehydratase [Synergistaceae bacterium]|jgi:NAD(P)H-hydrate epimerase|nr:NAD(P)H-hydrate dehydratase [Synergistaceae bacterium]
MKKYFDSHAVREADKKCPEVFGIPGEILMENAGRGAADIIAENYPGARRILILCGPGNNGGDGFVAARHLDAAGYSATVISTRAPKDYLNEARFAAIAAVKSGIRVLREDSLGDEDISSEVRGADVVVDALLGTGSSGTPRAGVRRLIEMSSGHGHIVAFDIPSGVNSDTGEVGDVSVCAELTIAFLAERPGHAVAPGTFRCGTTVTAGIGVKPDLVLDSPALSGYDASDIFSMIPNPPRDIHKNSRGRLLIIGGSRNYRGAPVLSARSALRAGCGIVTLAVPESAAASAAYLLPEAIFVPLPEKNGHIDFEGFKKIFSVLADGGDSLVLGPGLGRSPDAFRAARFIYEKWTKPLLIDADALRAGYPGRRDNVIATPHAGEAAHILGVTPAEVEKRRIESCESLAEKFGAALLKGPHTLISDGCETRVILEGGPELAVPGSGDALSGIIGAYLAYGIKPMEAATLGALIHGTSGKILSGRGVNGLFARDIADGVRDVLQKT